MLLLHGYPQTHVMWHHVAPILAEHHTVILTDLRGYGDSGKPRGRPDPRGVREAHDGAGPGSGDARARLRRVRRRRPRPRRPGRPPAGPGLPPPASPSSPCWTSSPPGTPSARHLEFGLGYWHWFFLAQPEPLPEHLLGADPEGWVRGRLSTLAAGRPAVRPRGAGRVRPLLPRPGRDPRLVRGLPRRGGHRPGTTTTPPPPAASGHRAAARAVGRARLRRPPLRRRARDLARVRRQGRRLLAALRPLSSEEVPAETAAALQDFSGEPVSQTPSGEPKPLVSIRRSQGNRSTNSWTRIYGRSG